MRVQHTQVTTTIDTDIVILSLFDELEKPDTSKHFWQNMETYSGFNITAGAVIAGVSFPRDESGMSEILEPLAQDLSASLKLNYDEEVESGVTQEFIDSQVQHFDFLSYTEEDLLDWDAAITTPPPRPSGTIRVKLKYKGRSKPFPAENFWKE